jgi:hypothetical protein
LTEVINIRATAEARSRAVCPDCERLAAEVRAALRILSGEVLALRGRLEVARSLVHLVDVLTEYPREKSEH